MAEDRNSVYLSQGHVLISNFEVLSVENTDEMPLGLFLFLIDF